MAKEAKPEAEVAEATPPKKKSKKLLIIIAIVVVLVLVIGGAAAFLLLKARSAHDGEDGATSAEMEKSGKKGKEVIPVYVALDAFTVNLVPENGDQFLQLMISVEVEDAPPLGGDVDLGEGDDHVGAATARLGEDQRRQGNPGQRGSQFDEQHSRSLRQQGRRPGPGSAVYLFHNPVAHNGHRLSLPGRG